MTPFESEHRRDAVEELGFPGLVRYDKERRLAAEQGAEDRGVDRFHR